MHRPLRARPRLRSRQPPRPQPFRRTHHDRLHGLLRRHQRSQVSPSHRPFRARGLRSHLEPRTLHPSPPGDARISSRSSPSCSSPMAAPPASSAPNPTASPSTAFSPLTIPDTSHLITWRIGDLGFDMQLSGQVPGEIGRALKELGHQSHPRPRSSIHRPLGRASRRPHHSRRRREEASLCPTRALSSSRDILLNYGNMSSATVMFVLQQVMSRAQSGQTGCAMSFGPGLTAETMLFHAA